MRNQFRRIAPPTILLLFGLAAFSATQTEAEKLVEAGKWAEAETAFAVLETKGGLTPEQVDLAVRASTQLNNWDRVAELLLTLRKTQPLNFDQRVALYEAYLRSGNRQQAEVELKALVRERPHNERLIHLLAFLYLSQNEFSKSIEVYHEFLDTHPDVVESYVNVALVEFKLMQGDHAFVHLKKAFANDYTAANEYFYRQLARNVAPQGLVELARDTKRELGLPHDEAEAHLLLAKEYEQLARHDLAIDHYERYLTSSAANDEIRFSLAKLYYYVGQEDKSEEMLGPLLERGGAPAASAILLGAEIAVKTSNFDRAAVLLGRLSAPENQSALAQFLLARVKISRNELEPARKLLEGSLKADPDFAETYFHLAQILLRTGQIEKGRELMQEYQRRK